MQNIPSHEKTIRMLFKSREDIHDNISDNGEFAIPITDEVETDSGWKYISEIDQFRDRLIINGFPRNIAAIHDNGDFYIIQIVEGGDDNE